MSGVIQTQYDHVAVAVVAAPLIWWAFHLKIYPTPFGTTPWKRYALYMVAGGLAVLAVKS